MDGQGGLMRDRSPLSEREAGAHVLIPLGHGPAREPEETSLDARPVTTVRVMLLRLVGVPDVASLGCGEVAALPERDRVERTTQVIPGCHEASLPGDHLILIFSSAHLSIA